MSVNQLSLTQLSVALAKGELKPSTLVKSYYDAYCVQQDLNAYVEFFEDALELAQVLDTQRPTGHPLWAMPGAIKDNFSVKNRYLSCASQMLANYVSPYTSTLVQRLEEVNFINLGRLNMDEFAMGATGRYSVHGPTLNPLDKMRVPGGSSSGSASAVAAHTTAFALGSDTGGSSRLPASYTGVCGFKPSHGALSRYGLTAFAPSLDVPGILAQTPADIAMVFHALAGVDTFDESTRSVNITALAPIQPLSLKGVKIASFSSLMKRADISVQVAYAKAEAWFVAQGAVLKEVDLGFEDTLLRTYYAICCSEAASSLARFDGARYGLKLQADTIEELFCQTRHDGFGHEVRRRILLGNYFLKEENYDQWYNKAAHIRNALRERIIEIAQNGCQLFLWPGFHEASPIDAPPVDNYTSDLVGVLANLFGGPALAMPIHSGEAGLPVSVQLSGVWGNDAQVLQTGSQLYTDLAWR